MNHDELKGKIDKLHDLMSNPQPGLFSYQIMVVELMEQLCNAWRGDSK